jgi:hypothetical protein
MLRTISKELSTTDNRQLMEEVGQRDAVGRGGHWVEMGSEWAEIVTGRGGQR